MEMEEFAKNARVIPISAHAGKNKVIASQFNFRIPMN
jgi:hypothetical protein